MQFVKGITVNKRAGAPGLLRRSFVRIRHHYLNSECLEYSLARETIQETLEDSRM